MVAEWLLALAATGATTLVGAAATDAWTMARDGFVRVLGLGDRRQRELIEQRLDHTASEVALVEGPDRGAVLQAQLIAWQTRLTDLLQERPELADDLRALIVQVQSGLPSERAQWVQQISASAPGATAQGAMFGNVINHYYAPAQRDEANDRPKPGPQQ
ncbi:hypothetical protein [Micromonospora sp. LOL_023]|uniref:hypothetical protein n=1 Tax=Micromonospora sp. LOL_023 TaxID=3345418 RepID=UPI003A84BCBE